MSHLDDESFERELFALRAHALAMPSLDAEEVFARSERVPAAVSRITRAFRGARTHGQRFAPLAGASLGILLALSGAIRGTGVDVRADDGALFSADDTRTATTLTPLLAGAMSPLVPACVAISVTDEGASMFAPRAGGMCEAPAPSSDLVACGRNVTCALERP